MLASVRRAIPISSKAYDEELTELIEEAKADLSAAGIAFVENDPLIRRAIKTYCKLHFGAPENPELLRESYITQKAQLQTSSGRTDWGENNGE